jgi:hypothetical protein
MSANLEACLDELALRCFVCFDRDTTLGDLACCHSLVCEECARRLERCSVCRVPVRWTVNVPVTRACRGVSIKSMTFAASARLGAKLHTAEYQLEMIDELPSDTAQLLQIGLELHDQESSCATRLAQFVTTHAEPAHRDRLRKVFTLGRMMPSFKLALRRLLLQSNCSLTPLGENAFSLLREVYKSAFPLAQPLIPSPIRSRAVSPRFNIFRTPVVKHYTLVPAESLPEVLRAEFRRCEPKNSRRFMVNIDLGEADLELPDGRLVRCSTKLMIMLLHLPATTVDLRTKCQFPLHDEDMHVLRQLAQQTNGVWALK